MTTKTIITNFKGILLAEWVSVHQHDKDTAITIGQVIEAGIHRPDLKREKPVKNTVWKGKR